MRLPESYVINKLYAYAYNPSYRKHDGTYNAGCPVCKEGKSLGKKKRLFYYPESNTFYCFNCSKSWTAYQWVRNVCNLTKEELDYEIATNEYSNDIEKKFTVLNFKKKELPDLPYDSINLFDKVQQSFYSKNQDFLKALQYIRDRRLETAVNRSPNLFISLTDVIHKNRICIPFYDRKNKVIFYQTRAIDKTEPRYLGKQGYDKTLFGIDRVSNDIPYIFIFEGPIDAMFVKNGVSAAGIKMSEHQENQLSEFPFHKKIWVLDNPKFDETADQKTREMVMKGEKVFKWPLGMSYKDFNEKCVFEDLDEIDYQIIIDNLY